MKKLNLYKKSLSLLTAAVMSFSFASCNKNNKEESRYDDFGYKIRTESEIEELTKEYDEYIKFNSSLPVKYDNLEYYPTLEEVREEYKSFTEDSKCTYKFDGDIDAVVSQIRKNTEKFMEEKGSTFKLSKRDDLYLNLVSFFDYDKDGNILHSFIESLVQFSNNNIDEDICSLQDLKIVVGAYVANSSGVYVDDEDLLILNFPAIEVGAKENDIPVAEYFVHTVRHELNHRRQYSCKHRNYKNISVIKKSEAVPFILESSAESETYKLDSSFDIDIKDTTKYSYTTERNQEGSIILLGLCNPSVSIDDYYNSILDSDLDLFYKYCSADDEVERLRINRILYSLDTISGRTELSKSDLSEDYKIAGTAHNTEIFKIVLDNMMKYTIEHEDFTFEENLLTFYIVESVILHENTCAGKLASDDVLLLISNYSSFIGKYYNITDKEQLDTLQKVIDNDISTINLDTLYSENSGLSENVKNIFNRFPVLKSAIFPKYKMDYTMWRKDTKEKIKK